MQATRHFARKNGVFLGAFFAVAFAGVIVLLSLATDSESIQSSSTSLERGITLSSESNQVQPPATTLLETDDPDSEVLVNPLENSATDSSSQANTGSNVAESPSVKAVASQDIVTSLDPTTGASDWLGSARNVQLQSAGQIINYPFELPLAFNGTPRISLNQDNMCGPVISFVATSDDPDTAGQAAIRTESRHSEVLPLQENFWQVFRIKTSDFSQTTDDQIIFQWHDGDGTAQEGSLNPFLSFNLTGSKLVAVARSNSGTPNNETNLVHTLHTDNSFAHETWYDYVVQAKIAPSGDGLINIWRNGDQIVSYSGAFGYDDGSTAHNAKMGIYHWATESYNSWDQSAPRRSVSIDYMALIRDPSQSYTFSDLANHMQQNATCG